MKRCTLCGELSDGTINIYSSYRDVQVVNLIEVYTHLRAGWLRTQFCCYHCLVTLSECNNLRKKAEDMNFYGNFPRDSCEADNYNQLISSISSISMNRNSVNDEESRCESDAENSRHNLKRERRSDLKYRRFENNINASSSTIWNCREIEKNPDHQPKLFSKRVYNYFASTESERDRRDSGILPQVYPSYVSSGLYTMNKCRGYEQYLKHFNESFMPNSSFESRFKEDTDTDSEIAFGICIGN